MPKQPDPSAHLTIDHAQAYGEGLRLLSRSPHPYHRQHFELLHPADTLASPSRPPATTTATTLPPPDSRESLSHSFRSFTKESTPTSDSGTDADDEHFLKGLPAPKAKLHKGLRGRNEAVSGTSTPLLSPAILEDEGRKVPLVLKRDIFDRDIRNGAEKGRRRKELVRRSTELLLLVSLGRILYSNPEVAARIRLWKKGMDCL